MPIGRCMRCSNYGDVENHHYYPRRWFGIKNNPVEVLCTSCHSKADRLANEVDAKYSILSSADAKYYKGVFKVKFLEFMNSCLGCDSLIERHNRITLLHRVYHPSCLFKMLRGEYEKNLVVHSNNGDPCVLIPDIPSVKT